MVEGLKPLTVTESVYGENYKHSGETLIVDPNLATVEEMWRQQYHNSLSISPNELVETFDKYKDKLDVDKNGFVESGEANPFSLRDTSRREELMLEALLLYQKDLEEQSNDEIGDEDSGLTSSDVSQLATDWDLDANLDLLRRIDYLASRSFRGRELIDEAYGRHLNEIRQSSRVFGAYAGMAVGGGLGVTIAVNTGMWGAPLIPLGFYGGAAAGAYLGDQAGRLGTVFSSEERFMRRYVDEQLEID